MLSFSSCVRYRNKLRKFVKNAKMNSSIIDRCCWQEFHVVVIIVLIITQVSRLIILSWSWYTSSFLFPFYLSLSLSRMCSPISGGAGLASVPSSLPPLTSSQPAHLLAINSSNSKGKDRERPPLLPGCCHSCAFCYLIMLSRVCAQTNLQIKKDSDWGASLVHSVEQLSHML